MTNLSKQQIKFLITCGVELCAVYGFCCQLGNELEQVSILGIGENKVQPLRILEFGKRENSMLVICCPDSFYRGLLGRIKGFYNGRVRLGHFKFQMGKFANFIIRLLCTYLALYQNLTRL